MLVRLLMPDPGEILAGSRDLARLDVSNMVSSSSNSSSSGAPLESASVSCFVGGSVLDGGSGAESVAKSRSTCSKITIKSSVSKGFRIKPLAPNSPNLAISAGVAPAEMITTGNWA